MARRSARLWLSDLWLKTERMLLYRLIRFFRIRGESERVARGFASGLVVNFFPTFGFGVLIAGVIARLMGGNMAAGFAGGSILMLAWPLLFYFNIRTGSWLRQRRSPIQDPDQLTEQVIDALSWGKTFTLGALANSLLAFLSSYILIRLLYARIRPAALAYFRRHARDHQGKYSRRRLHL